MLTKGYHKIYNLSCKFIYLPYTMTRKYYVMIARWLIILKTNMNNDDRRMFLLVVIGDLEKDNSKFNKEKFLSFINKNAN